MIKILEDKEVMLSDGTYSIGPRSLYIGSAKRTRDGVVVAFPVNLPLSQIRVRRSNTGVVVEVPDWLYKDRYKSDYVPYGGY